MKSRVDSRRIHQLNDHSQVKGPVLYWMSRDQRVNDNWALLYAQDLALNFNQPLAVIFCLALAIPGATVRQYRFMLDGLKQTAGKLRELNLPFYLLNGSPPDVMPVIVDRLSAGAVVTDFSPLRINRQWQTALVEQINVPLYEVDAHNIVPCRLASSKREYAAYTIRPKINRLLGEFLTDLPSLKPHPILWPQPIVQPDFDEAWGLLNVDTEVPAVDWTKPGEEEARKTIERFLEDRLQRYYEDRNDPPLDVQSNLSPYLHFGQIAAQRVALDVQRCDQHIKSQEAFMEELIVRRELADNYCFYCDHYDSMAGFPEWAIRSLDRHRADPRPYLYNRDQFERGKTHDQLWNAAQNEMVYRGKMHGYLRMYWAKKLLEWTPSAEDALTVAIYLNDKYELDGCDPNGYAGIAWSIGGVHDRPWFEREIFGQVRYMSESGCRRKFDVPRYIAGINLLRGDT